VLDLAIRCHPRAARDLVAPGMVSPIFGGTLHLGARIGMARFDRLRWRRYRGGRIDSDGPTASNRDRHAHLRRARRPLQSEQRLPQRNLQSGKPYLPVAR